jgi:hypothetical protein
MTAKSRPSLGRLYMLDDDPLAIGGIEHYVYAASLVFQMLCRKTP